MNIESRDSIVQHLHRLPPARTTLSTLPARWRGGGCARVRPL